jgi:hypothetical protein
MANPVETPIIVPFLEAGGVFPYLDLTGLTEYNGVTLCDKKEGLICQMNCLLSSDLPVAAQIVDVPNFRATPFNEPAGKVCNLAVISCTSCLEIQARQAHG